jgi:hypothetical protein
MRDRDELAGGGGDLDTVPASHRLDQLLMALMVSGCHDKEDEVALRGVIDQLALRGIGGDHPPARRGVPRHRDSRGRRRSPVRCPRCSGPPSAGGRGAGSTRRSLCRRGSNLLVGRVRQPTLAAEPMRARCMWRFRGRNRQTHRADRDAKAGQIPTTTTTRVSPVSSDPGQSPFPVTTRRR